MISEQEKEGYEDSSLITLRAEIPVYGGFVLGRIRSSQESQGSDKEVSRRSSDSRGVNEGKIIFIKGAIPGELVDLSLKDSRRDYSIGEVMRVLEPSQFRRRPPCPYFGLCGGCHLQYMEYGKQVSIKEEVLRDTLQRIGGIDIREIPSLTGNEFFYRHRVQFKVSKEGKIGFFREGTRDIVMIDRCLVIVEPINELLSKLHMMDLRGIKELHVISGDTLAVLIKGNIGDETIQALLDSGVSGIAFENGDSIGKDYITLEYSGLRYTVTPWGFFQGHWSLNEKVVDLILERLSPLEGKRVLDLYSGAGNFSLPLARSSAEVIAIEENHYAIEDGKRNAMINGIKNCLFIQSPVDEVLRGRKGILSKKSLAGRSSIFDEKGYDIVILDPPRPGLSTEMCKRLLELGSERIVYVSCNPATLARDLKRMLERYIIESLHMVDFFPNTYHIEAVAFLRLR